MLKLDIFLGKRFSFHFTQHPEPSQPSQPFHRHVPSKPSQQSSTPSIEGRQKPGKTMGAQGWLLVLQSPKWPIPSCLVRWPFLFRQVYGILALFEFPHNAPNYTTCISEANSSPPTVHGLLELCATPHVPSASRWWHETSSVHSADWNLDPLWTSLLTIHVPMWMHAHKQYKNAIIYTHNFKMI